MNEKSIVITSAAGLSVGCILGMAGSIVPSDSFRDIAWAVDPAGIILSSALLSLYYVRGGFDALAGVSLYLPSAKLLFFPVAQQARIKTFLLWQPVIFYGLQPLHSSACKRIFLGLFESPGLSLPFYSQ